MALCSSPVSHILRSFDRSTTIQSSTSYKDVAIARDNYKNWSVCMKNYLLAQDLWDIIEASSERKAEDSEADIRNWRKKNAAALLAMQNSCEPNLISEIGEITSAKDAWNALAKIYEPTTVDESGQPAAKVEEHQLPATITNQQSKVQELQAPTLSQGDSSNLQPQRATANQGTNNVDYSQFKPLHVAINRADWDLVRHILYVYPDAITAKVSIYGETLLHLAIIAGHVKIVENLVELMSEQDIEIRDTEGLTALGIAAMYGRTEIAKCIVRKNEELVVAPDKRGHIPLVMALRYAAHQNMIRYLYSVTPIDFLLSENGSHGSLVLSYFISLRMFDFALDLLRRGPHLTMVPNKEWSSPVVALAYVPTAFPSGCRLTFWQRFIYSSIHIGLPAVTSDIRINTYQETEAKWENTIVQVLLHQLRGPVSNFLEIIGFKKIYDMKLMHTYALEVVRCMSKEISALDSNKLLHGVVLYPFFEAAKRGIVEFIVEMIKAKPDFMTVYFMNGRSVILSAVENRQEKIFSLLYGFNERKLRVVFGLDDFRNNLLHLAGLLAPSSQLDHISGAALQMQRELQWYKEVEGIVHPLYKEQLNNNGETPSQVFTRYHKDLVKEGEKWMKDTSTSCTVVGALIITVMFSAAFTVPGGNDQNTGFPIFLHKKYFKVFIISDAISLFASSTSVLMFLGILTSRYAENDFLKSLPTKLIIGLSTLFISIAAMIVAFSAALLIMLEGFSWITIPVILLASVPVTLFVLLQFPLLVEIFMSTYGPRIFDRKMKPLV